MAPFGIRHVSNNILKEEAAAVVESLVSLSKKGGNKRMLFPPPIIIQLWSNKDESAFAVRLSTDQQGCFRAIVVTVNHHDDNRSKFTKIADEMYYDESFHYDWPFMLERWIEAWKSGFMHSSLTSALLRWNDAAANGKGMPSSSFRHESNNSEGSRSKGNVAMALLSEPDVITTMATRRQEKTRNSRISSTRKNRKRQKKPNLKCHYCNLMFYKETERSAHEETWHAGNKFLLLKSNSNNNSSLRSGGDAADDAIGKVRVVRNNNGR